MMILDQLKPEAYYLIVTFKGTEMTTHSRVFHAVSDYDGCGERYKRLKDQDGLTFAARYLSRAQVCMDWIHKGAEVIPLLEDGLNLQILAQVPDYTRKIPETYSDIPPEELTKRADLIIPIRLIRSICELVPGEKLQLSLERRMALKKRINSSARD